jgi:hypothetical protein
MRTGMTNSRGRVKLQEGWVRLQAFLEQMHPATAKERKALGLSR